MDNKSLLRSFVPVLFFLAIAGFIFSVSQRGHSNTAQLDYGQFMEQVKSGNIAAITIEVSGNTSGAFYKPLGANTNFSTVIPNESRQSVAEKIMDKDTETQKARVVIRSSGSFFDIILYSWGPILLMLFFWIFMMRRMAGGENKALSFGKSKAKLNQNGKKKVTFKDVAGVDEAKYELQETIEFLKEPAKFMKLGGRLPKGVLLIGPPGTGKTLLARAVAGEANVPFFSISGSDFVEMFVGVGASRVRDLFEQGKKNSPCIIFIDELDAVGRHRGAGIGGGHDEREQTLNQLLVEMDGFEDNSGTVIIAATNRPDVLDPALLRPGRFDRRVVVDRPDIKGREGILAVHIKKIPLSEDVDIMVLARGTSGFSGADLANLVNEAALNAARYEQKSVRMTDFEFAKDKVLMGSERRSLVISEKEKKTTAVHEAGHAVITLLMPEADPLHKVTIIPRGQALGVTAQLPLEDRHNYSREQLETQLVILMGGKCAEEIILNQQTTGASNDIERATEIARQMVQEWGMSQLGPQNFATKDGSPFLGKRLTEKSYDYSEATAQKIDEEIRRLINEAYQEAKTIIQANINAVQRVADKLIHDEILTGEQIKKLVFSE